MTVHEKMIDFRTSRGLSLRNMQQRSGVPSVVLGTVEDGNVTHPNFVKRIKKAYKLTDEEAELLLPKNRRKHDPEYNPNKYVIEPDITAQRLLPKQSVIDRYVTEKHQEQITKDARRMR